MKQSVTPGVAWGDNGSVPNADQANKDGNRPAGGWKANEPAGLTQLTEKSFNTLTEMETSTDPDWYLNSLVGNKSIITDATAPVSPSNVLQHEYPIGFAGGASGTSAGYTAASHSKIYISLAVKWDANWEDHPTGTNKVIFITSDSFGGGGDPTFLSMNTQQASPRLIITNQGSGLTGAVPRVTEAIPTMGQWHIVEIFLQSNSADGVADGIAKLWLDGVLSTNSSTVEFYTGGGADGKFNNVKLEPTWGGAGGTVVSAFSLYHDEIYISGGN